MRVLGGRGRQREGRYGGGPRCKGVTATGARPYQRGTRY